MIGRSKFSANFVTMACLLWLGWAVAPAMAEEGQLFIYNPGRELKMTLHLVPITEAAPEQLLGLVRVENLESFTINDLKVMATLYQIPVETNLDFFSQGSLIPMTTQELLSPQPMMLRGGEETYFALLMPVPTHLPAGRYALGFEAVERGVHVVASRLYTELGELAGDGNFLQLLNTHSNPQGACRMTLLNAMPTAMTVTPHLQLYQHTVGGPLVMEEDRPAITIQPQAQHIMDLAMPAVKTPGDYIGLLQFFQDGQVVSPAATCGWVAKGPAVLISELRSNKGTYAAGEKAIVKVRLLLSPEAQTQSITLKLEMIDKASGAALGTASRSMLPQQPVFELDVPIALAQATAHIAVKAKLVMNRQIVAEQMVEHQPPVSAGAAP